MANLVEVAGMWIDPDEVVAVYPGTRRELGRDLSVPIVKIRMGNSDTYYYVDVELLTVDQVAGIINDARTVYNTCCQPPRPTSTEKSL